MSVNSEAGGRSLRRRRGSAWLFWGCLGAFAFARVFLFHLYVIPSGSMKSTLLVGDYVLVSKISYGLSKHNIPFAPDIFSGRLFASEPQRGDVIVFRPPHTPGTDFIKRVVGLPGDHIQVRDGTLFINGRAVDKRPIDDFDTVDCDQALERCHPERFRRFEETLPEGRKHATLYSLAPARGDRTREFIVKPGHYFMMGDNRNASEDSRFWQCEQADGRHASCPLVPAENLVGRASFIIFSRDERWRFWKPWTWPAHTRAERTFAPIR